MKSIQIAALALIFVCLMGFIFAYKYSKRDRNEANLPFSGINKAMVTRLEIKSGRYFYQFHKDNNAWQIMSPIKCDADNKKVENLIDKTLKIELGETISSDPSKYSSFEVDKDSGVQVSLYYADNDKPKADFIIGKQGYDYMHYYFRYTGSNDTMVCKGINKYEVGQELKDWRDKDIFVVNRSSVNRVELTYAGQQTTLALKDTKWFLGDPEKGKEANVNEVNMLLDNITNLRADDFADDATAINSFSKPEIKVVISTIDGKENTLLIGNKKDAYYYVKSVQKAEVFMVLQYKLDKLKEKIRGF